MTTTPKFVRYLAGGLIIGGFWYINKGRPPWEEAARTIVVFAVVMAVMKTRLRKRNVEVHLVPLVATKAVLVVIAAAVEQAIKGSVGQPALLVAAGLLVAVTIVGAIGDPWFFTLIRPPEGASPPPPVR